MATLAERIAELEAERSLVATAITRLLTAGGAVSIAGRTWTPIQLGELTKLRDKLDADLARLNGRSLLLQKGTFGGT